MSIKRFEFEPIGGSAVKERSLTPMPNPSDIEISDNTHHPRPQPEKNDIASFNQGYNQAKAEIDQQILRQQEIIALNLENLKQKFSEVIDTIKQNSEDNLKQMAILSVEVAKKVLDKLLNEQAEQYIQNILHRSLSLLVKENRITITVNPVLLENITNYINKIKDELHYYGNVEIQANEHVHEINCFIEWLDGKIENNYELIISTIEKVIIEESMSFNQKNNDNLAENSEENTNAQIEGNNG